MRRSQDVGESSSIPLEDLILPVHSPSKSSSKRPHSPSHSLEVEDSRRSSVGGQSNQDGVNPPEDSPNHLSESIEGFPALPPVDRGKDAYLFIAGACTAEMFIWGMPYTIGILLNHWTTVLFPGQGLSTLTLAGTLQSGMLYMAFSIVGPLYTAMPHKQRTIQIVGLVVSSVSIVASGFVTQPWHLLVTTGILFSFASAIYIPAVSLIFEWFAARRGLAGGVLWSATGLGGVILPYLLEYLLKTYSYKVAMSTVGAVFFVGNAIAIIPIKRRIPLTLRRAEVQRTGRRRGVNWGILKLRGFWIGASVVLLTGLGMFIPTLWLPTFSRQLGINHPNGTDLIALMSAASVPGQMFLGYMTDRYSVRTVIAVNAIGSAIGLFVLWGLAQGKVLLALFAISWGFTGMSSTGWWGKIIADAAGDDIPMSGLIFSFYSCVRGIGNVVTGPISERFLTTTAFKGATGAYGFMNYGPLIVYNATLWVLTLLAGMGYSSH